MNVIYLVRMKGIITLKSILTCYPAKLVKSIGTPFLFYSLLIY